MIETILSGNEHSLWDIDRVFLSMDAAKAYIAQRKAEHRGYYDQREFELHVEDVYE